MQIVCSCIPWVPCLWGCLLEKLKTNNTNDRPLSDDILLSDDTLSENSSCGDSFRLNDEPTNEGNSLLLPSFEVQLLEKSKTNNTVAMPIPLPDDALLSNGSFVHSDTLSENSSCGDSFRLNAEPPNEDNSFLLPSFEVQLLEKSKTNNTVAMPIPLPDDALLSNGSLVYSDALSENSSCADSPRLDDEPPNESDILLLSLGVQVLEKLETNNTIDMLLPDALLSNGSFVHSDTLSENSSCGDSPHLKDEPPNEGNNLVLPSFEGQLLEKSNSNNTVAMPIPLPDDALLSNGSLVYSDALSENSSCADSPRLDDEPPNESNILLLSLGVQVLEKLETNNTIDMLLPDALLSNGSFVHSDTLSENSSCGDSPHLKDEPPNEGNNLVLPSFEGQLLEKSNSNNTVAIPLPDDALLSNGSFVHRRSLSENCSCGDSPCLTDEPSNEGNILLLPEDIIINIFSQLTAEDAFQCLRVCRTLRAILLTPSFVAMNLQRANPPILVIQCAQLVYGYELRPNLHERDLDLHFIDRDKGIAVSTKYLRATNDYKPLLIGSYNGMLLFINSTLGASVFFIWNPITEEQVTVIAPDQRYCICGFFFHTPTNEYRILYTCWELVHSKYMILSLGTKLLRKIANRTEIPCNSRPPTILNGALHWMVDEDQTEGRYNLEPPSCSKSIMLFHMISEEFTTMAHPGEECCSRERHKYMQLLEWDGRLCLFDIISNTKVYFWVLQDYGKQVWVKTHTINIEPLIAEHVLRDIIHSLDYTLQALYIHQEELLFKWNWWEIYYFHLKSKTFRKVRRDYIPMDCLASVVVHYNSIVSLHSDSLIAFEDP